VEELRLLQESQVHRIQYLPTAVQLIDTKEAVRNFLEVVGNSIARPRALSAQARSLLPTLE